MGTSMSQPEIGRLIKDRYQLTHLISVGGMGEVYQAVDLQMFSRVVAVKLLHPRLISSQDLHQQLRRRFQEEARISALLGDHPNIIKVHDYGLDRDAPFLVMEYLGSPPLQGQSLTEILKQRQSLPVGRVVRLARQLCAGLHYAHGFEAQLENQIIKGVIHRDIKPSNIFVLTDPALGRTDETVKILDFGVAKIISDMSLSLGTEQLGFVGSPMYASPEQLRGKKLDARSDIYSLGIVLYEMLTGHLPLQPETDSIWAWIEAHNHLDPLPMQQHLLPHAVSSAVESVIMSCLSKDPDQRPVSMEQLSLQLYAALHPDAEGAEGLPPVFPAPVTSPDSVPPEISTSLEKTDHSVAAAEAVTISAQSDAEVPQQLQEPSFPSSGSPRRYPPQSRLWRTLVFVGVLILCSPGLVWILQRQHSPPGENNPSLQPSPSPPLTLRELYERQRRRAVREGDWVSAIELVDLMVAEFPEDREELLSYRQYLQENLENPESVPLSPSMKRILGAYLSRLSLAISQGNWIAALEIVEEARTSLPQETLGWEDYRQALQQLQRTSNPESTRQALTRLADGSTELAEAVSLYLRVYQPPRRSASPSPVPLSTPLFPATPIVRPTPSPSPTPIPRQTPIQIPTLDPDSPPDLTYVCRLQPDLGICRSRSPQPEQQEE
jgi:serine/threonine protein kinase